MKKSDKKQVEYWISEAKAAIDFFYNLTRNPSLNPLEFMGDVIQRFSLSGNSKQA